MSDDYLILDLGHRRSSANQFSTSKVKRSLKKEDIQAWATSIRPSTEGVFAYPASLQSSIIHQQSCYLQPDSKFLEKNPNLLECQCCKQRINRLRVNWICVDLYSFLVQEYGITTPLYFTFLKLHIILLLLIGVTFGAFFSYHSVLTCTNQQKAAETINKYLIENSFNATYARQQVNITCHENSRFWFIPQDDFLLLMQAKNQENTYYCLAIIVYMIILLTPFIHEIVMRSKQIQYWSFDPWNFIQFDKLSIYVKHLPNKLTEAEIQEHISQTLESKNLLDKSRIFEPNQQPIDELLYVYDTHPLKVMNDKRQKDFLELMITAHKIKEHSSEQELHSRESTQVTEELVQLKEKFSQLVIELMIQTKEMYLYIEQGLPFTNKIILKLKKQEYAEIIYKYYYRGFYDGLKKKIQALRTSREIMLKDQMMRASYDRRESLLSASVESLVLDNSSDKQSDQILTSKQDLNQVLRSKSQWGDHDIVQKGKRSDQEITQSNKSIHINKMKAMIDNIDQVEELALSRLQLVRQQEITEKNQGISVERGFRQDDIFWENIGMHTIKRFTLSLLTFITAIVASAITMGIFEALFVYQNNPKLKRLEQEGKVSIADKVIIEFSTLMIVFLAVLGSIITLVTTIRSRRSTYSQQEKNIINFMSFTSLVLILSFPYFLVLTQWKGLQESLPIYNLILLGRIRVVFKGLTHVFHLRNCSFWCRRRKIVKNFQPTNYFQGQLNQLMTPNQFPIRARLLFAFFVFSTGYLMIFLAPEILILCLVFQIFFYYFDRYSLFKVYRIDKLFTYQLLHYLVDVYQIIMTPIYIFIFYMVFRKREYIIQAHQVSIPQAIPISICYVGEIGLALGIVILLTFICFGSRIVDYVVMKVLRYKKNVIEKPFPQEKTYFQSYQDYFEQLNIDNLDQALVTIFKQIEQKTGSRKSLSQKQS